jgi:hypothetical protein
VTGELGAIVPSVLRKMVANSQFFWFLLFPLMVVLIATLVCCSLAILGVPHMIGLSQIIGNGGTLAVVMVAFGYIVFRDSRRRWPGVPFLIRVGRVLTFYRG